MAEHLFIKKRQKDRRKHSFLMVKLILRLVVTSALLLFGFLYFVGTPMEELCATGCESDHSLGAYIIAVLILLGGVILLGGLTGALLAYLRGSRQNNSMFTLVNEQETREKPTESKD